MVFSRTVLDRAFDPAHFTFARAGHPAPRFRAAAERLLRDVPARGNFYLHYLFDRTYPDDQRCPAWLRRGAPTALRDRLGGLASATGTLEAWLAAAPDRSVDVFALSNCFDWVSGTRFTALLGDLVRVARPGARIGWWTNLVNTAREPDPDLFPQIVPDRATAAAVEAGCRTPGYSPCYLARWRAEPGALPRLAPPEPAGTPAPAAAHHARACSTPRWSGWPTRRPRRASCPGRCGAGGSTSPRPRCRRAASPP